MKITPSSSSKKPSYPTLLAIAAVGAMMSPAYAQNEAENPPEAGAAKVPQQALKAPGTVKASRDSQRVVGRFKPRYPKEGKGSDKPATPPEKK